MAVYSRTDMELIEHQNSLKVRDRDLNPEESEEYVIKDMAQFVHLTGYSCKKGLKQGALTLQKQRTVMLKTTMFMKRKNGI